MNGIRFYAELPDNRGSKSGSKKYQPFTRKYLASVAEKGAHVNCVAVIHANGRNAYNHYDCVAAVQGESNSPVCSTVVGSDYLRKRCVRITEKLARQLHPALFASGLIG